MVLGVLNINVKLKNREVVGWRLSPILRGSMVFSDYLVVL